MKPTPELTAAIDLVPGWNAQTCTVERLSGGLTNQTFLVDTGNSRAVLRLTTNDHDAIEPDRANELDILGHAAAAGIAPATIYSSEENGVLVTEYLSGTVWSASNLTDRGNLGRLAKLLRAVHGLPTCEMSSDPAVAAGRYADYLEHRGESSALVAQCLAIVNCAAKHEDVSCCHNDVVAGNIIAAENLKLIDWEYAGNNNPYFDLASIVGFHDLGSSQVEILLQNYSGSVSAENRAQLAEQLRIFDAIQWLWLACRNYATPSPDHRQRLAQLAMRIR